MFKHKLKATLIHLCVSFLAVGLIIGALLYFLFPQLFFSVSSFKEVALLIISIDLILGPLLTFVVYQPNKKSLKFDLSVVAIIQFSALAYGAFALFQVHPVYVTFNVDRFTIVTAKDATPETAKYDEYKISKLSAGKLAFAKIPTSIDKRNRLILSVASGGPDIDQQAEYYEPYKNNIAEIIAKSLDPEIVFKNETDKIKAKKFLAKYKEKLDLFAFLPLNSSTKDAIIVLKKDTAEPIATIDIDPWELSKK